MNRYERSRSRSGGRGTEKGNDLYYKKHYDKGNNKNINRSTSPNFLEQGKILQEADDKEKLKRERLAKIRAKMLSNKLEKKQDLTIDKVKTVINSDGYDSKNIEYVQTENSMVIDNFINEINTDSYTHPITEEDLYYNLFLQKFNIKNIKNDDIQIENIEDNHFKLEKVYLNDNQQEDIVLDEIKFNDDETRELELDKLRKKLEKGKEIIKVNHKEIDYDPLIKNIYRESLEIRNLSEDEVKNFRKLYGDIHIRGATPPNPVMNWYQCNLPESILKFITEEKKFKKPFPIQCQGIPTLLSGLNLIGIAETGSGKTLCYLIPMISHILQIVQYKPLKFGEGPIGIIIVPSRELAWQIYSESKNYTSLVGLDISCVFGGSSTDNQISNMKRGSHIVVCTPGRMIDILSLNKGKLVNLSKVSFIVLDEADRMFDLGFSDQINKILLNVRPDRQICMFSATFHQKVEEEAKILIKSTGKSKICEIIVGTKGKACGNVEQFVEILSDTNLRFVKLLEILEDLHSDEKYVFTKFRISNFIFDIKEDKPTTSIFGLKNIEHKISILNNPNKNIQDLALKQKANVDKDPKILIFVEDVKTADHLFRQLLLKGFPAQVLHSNLTQQDRFEFIEDFRTGFKTIMISTSILARGIDFPDLEYVINFNCPNHYEDYIHRIGRTGRANNKGVSITFISKDEEHLADVVIKALELSNQIVPKELREMQSKYEVKLEKGEKVKYKFKITDGRGYKHDNEEELEKEKEKKNIKNIYSLISGENLAIAEDDVVKIDTSNMGSKVVKLYRNRISHLKSKETNLMLKDENNVIVKKINAVKNIRAKQKFISIGKTVITNSLLAGDSVEVAKEKAIKKMEEAFENFTPNKKNENKRKEMNTILEKWTQEDNVKKSIFSKDLELNSYPEIVRSKVSRKEFKDKVKEISACKVKIEGEYFKGKVPPGKRKLHIHIIGKSEFEVENTYKEILRWLNSWAIEAFSGANLKYKI